MGAHELATGNVVRGLGLQQRGVAVEVQRVVAAGVRTRFQPAQTPQGSGLAGGGRHAGLGQDGSEALRDAWHPEFRGDDVAGELGRVGDHEIGLPLQRDRDETVEHLGSGNGAPELPEHDRGDLVRRQIVELGVSLLCQFRPDREGRGHPHRTDVPALNFSDTAVGERP